MSVFSLGFKDKSNEEITLERVNEWNRKQGLFGAAFINQVGLAQVCSLHSVRAGSNKKIVGNWLKEFSTTMIEFEKFTR